jgi:hypothetical protein
MTQLRIGFILPDESIPAWAAQLIEKACSLPGVEGVATIIIPQKETASSLFRSYFKLDRRAFHPKPSPWELQSLPAGLPRLHGGGSAQLQALRLDVLINLSLVELPDGLPALARLGVWTLRDGLSRLVIGAPMGWRELFHDNLVTTCQVEVLREGRLAQIVTQALLATDPLSTSRNQLRLLWRASVLMPLALYQLGRRGEDDFFGSADPAPQVEPLPQIQSSQSPNLLQLMALSPKQLTRKLAKKFRKRFLFDQWMLMIAPRAQNASLGWDGFRPLLPPRDRFWADPFVVEREGQTYVFVEELFFATNLGTINCLVLDAEGRVASNTPLLERPYHLSYPFVFEYQDTWYMVPETNGNRSVELYRCLHFPDQWAFEKTLLRDVPALDATLLEYEGRWWMFVNLISDQGNSTWDTLHLYYADNPLSENWTAHPRNPIVADVRSARPAGRMFLRDGKLMRPSQDSTTRYGYRLHLNRVDKLTVNDYAETSVETLTPPPGRNIIATHTYNSAGNLTVIDIQTRRSKFTDWVKI